jgi:Uncharacterized conserved protein
MQIFTDGGPPILAWIDGVGEIEASAMAQLAALSRLPFIHKHVAVMPDVHAGRGSTVGSVIATKGAIIPAAVGVDIGCGMMAVRTSLTSQALPDNLGQIRSSIEAAVPHGRTDHGGPNDRGAWGDVPDAVLRRLFGSHAANEASLADRFAAIVDKHPKLRRNADPDRHLGTLGTGNHFIEVCLDEADRVWVMLHSGSRGAGNRIGSYFIERAKEECRRWFVDLEDADLAYLPAETPLFADYVDAVGWAQDYAMANRELMMQAALGALRRHLGDFATGDVAVNCHHNYVDVERHFGANVFVTRKGAVRARPKDLGIIPGSMGAKSYIVRGKGDPQSFCSCSHGTGRRMSRTQAKAAFTVADHIAATEGVECRKDQDVIDETPGAYKDIDAVIAAQADLIEVVHTLKQIVCVKG